MPERLAARHSPPVRVSIRVLGSAPRMQPVQCLVAPRGSLRPLHWFLSRHVLQEKRTQPVQKADSEDNDENDGIEKVSTKQKDSGARLKREVGESPVHDHCRDGPVLRGSAHCIGSFPLSLFVSRLSRHCSRGWDFRNWMPFWEFFFPSFSKREAKGKTRETILLVYSLSLHRHSYIGFILAFASSIHNNKPDFHNNKPDGHTRTKNYQGGTNWYKWSR